MKNNHANKLIKLVLAILLMPMLSCKPSPQKLSLEGEWVVVLDSLDRGIGNQWYEELQQGAAIHLPGTLDMAGLGKVNNRKPAMDNYVLSHLTRKTEYIGKAWYQREIEVPADWAGKPLLLELERVMWESKVWINGELLGTGESMVGPHRFIIAGQLKAGSNLITICVDNGNKYPNINVAGNKYPEPTSKDMAHAYTNHTQIKWNGILGEMSLRQAPILTDVQVYPDINRKKLVVSASFYEKAGDNESFSYRITQKGKVISDGQLSFTKNGKKWLAEIAIENEVKLWDEFNPTLYDLELSLGEEKAVRTFGMREIEKNKGKLQLNGRRIFLRGTLECAVFPQTGFPYMEKKPWLDIIQTAKNYGLNHFRFHSWCPPEAAFEAADELGFYLQVELPHWSLKVGEDEKTIGFLEKEGQSIIQEYGNHPSFILMSLGNELEGDISWMNEFTAKLKNQDNRHLYTTTTFSFQEGVGQVPQPEDDFFVTQWTDRGWIRGQGIFNDVSPHFDKDYQQEIEHIQVPVISHEIGQYSVYPDLSEIEKYKGVLQPLNFMAVKQDLEKKGLLQYAGKFTKASGKLAALLYKEEIERALKTPGFDGFQLLQLQDFPGQGTALVGLLNVFWESKGVIDSLEFSQFSNEIVPLLRFGKAVYRSDESFEATIQVANFYRELDGQTINWSIEGAGGVLASGKLENLYVPLGNEEVLGKIDHRLNVKNASKLLVKVELEGTSYKNEWPIWVYPEVREEMGNVVYTRSRDQAAELLAKGKSVFFNPDYEMLNGVTGRFVPVFWSPVHFPDQPSTMGLLCDPDHPALEKFPTEEHTNWQWWDLCIQSKSVPVSGLQVDPIVRVIDNFVTNRELVNVFEARVGEGKLLFSSIDLGDDLEERPVAKQLRVSLLNYMNSAKFDPASEISLNDLNKLFIDRDTD